MKIRKSSKKATFRRKAVKMVRVVVVEPLADLRDFLLDSMKQSRQEKNKLKSLDIQRKYLLSEEKSKNDILQYKEMLLPSQRQKIEAELKEIQRQIKDNATKQNILMGKRANRSRSKRLQYTALLGVSLTVGTVTFLLATGIMSLFGY